MQKIILAGGSGFLGSILAKYFHAKLFDIVIFSRNPKLYSPYARHIFWDAKHPGAWKEEFENAFAVINLTGKSVDCRYTKKNKQEILSSRTDSTKAVGEAILQCKNPPQVWINAASATIYPHSIDKDMDENNEERGDDFSVNVCKAWEKSFGEIETLSTRKIIMRTSLVLGNYSHSVLPVLKRLVRFGLGGKMGSGRQSFSWIHEEDYCRAIDFLLGRNDLQGAFNITAPKILSNAEFMKLLRREMKMPFGLGATEWMLKIGGFIIGTEAELILKSRRAVPKKLLESGFEFNFPDAASALHDLISNKNLPQRRRDAE